jgi:hypothetical protein
VIFKKKKKIKKNKVHERIYLVYIIRINEYINPIKIVFHYFFQ